MWRGDVPCLGDNDVVEGLVAFAEAGEADFHDHGGSRGEDGRGGMSIGGMVIDKKSIAVRDFEMT